MSRQHDVREHTRVRNGKVETVRQHTRGSGSGNNNDGGLGPVGKVILGGVALYVMGSIGLGWIEDIKDGIDTAQEIRQAAKDAKELEKTEAKDAKKSEKAEKKLEKDMNSQGYTEKFDTDEEELGLEAGDVRDIMEKIEEQVDVYNSNDVNSDSIMYIEPEVFDNSANYKAAILNRLKTMDKTPITFVAVYYDLSSKEAHKEYEHAVDICEINLNEDNGLYNSTDIKGFIGIPENETMTIAVTYSIEDIE